MTSHELEKELDAALARLKELDLEGLREVWAKTIGPVPRLRSIALLRHSIAWRLQARHYGGLSPETRRRLREKGTSDRVAGLAPGTRISREWRGVTHDVVVAEKGFLYAGRTWTSLSEIARVITGSRWSGPRFFGLRSGEGTFL